MLSLLMTPLYAQEKAVVNAAIKAPEMIYKVERQAARGLRISEGAAVRPPYRANPVSVADIQESLRLIGSPTTTQPTRAGKRTTPKASATPKESKPTPPPERYVSPLRDFLRDDWEMPESSRVGSRGGLSSYLSDISASNSRDQIGSGDPLRSAAIDLGMPADISLESVRMQARAMGVPSETIETASKSELWLLVHYYETMMNGGKILSRYDASAEAAKVEKTEEAVERWAKAQPDFIEQNYMVTDYYEPFNPSVQQLRVLVINDSQKIIDPLLDFAAHNSRITVEYVDSVAAAFPLLRGRPRYDIVLTDYVTHAGNAQELGMWALKEKIKIPIVFFSNAGGTASWLYSYNLAGSIGTSQPARMVLNYASNLVATGKAYPNR